MSSNEEESCVGEAEVINESEATNQKTANNNTVEKETSCDTKENSEQTKLNEESNSVEISAETANGENTELDDLDRKIIEQVEFYYGDINLPRDRFLQEAIKTEDGWVSLNTMLNFKRLASLTTDVEKIAAALQHSKLMEVSEDRTKIRRSVKCPLPENSLEYWQKIKHRTVYIKGFKQNASLDEILNFVRQFGVVDNVLMRRVKGPSHQFKGSVFVTFKDRETSQAFVANDTNEYDGERLIKLMQDDYWAKKQKEVRERRANERNARMLKKASDIEEQKKSQMEVIFIKGLILAVENVPKEKATIMKIKDFFRQYGDVAYVTYEDGEDKAEIRFNGEENGATRAWEAAVKGGEENKVMFEGQEITGRTLDGEEEKAYWTKFNEKKMEKFNRKGGRGGRGGGFSKRGGRQQHHKGYKRPNEGNGNEGPDKKAKKTVFNDEEQ